MSKDFEAIRQELHARKCDLQLFSQQYEKFLDLLLSQAQPDTLGASAEQENLYQHLRDWLSSTYPKIRPHLLAHLRFSPDDMVVCHENGLASADALQATWACPTLAGTIEQDQGKLADRLSRATTALEWYDSYLHKLLTVESWDDNTVVVNQDI